ncbi:tetratricopeptide repeat protein [Nocardia concava]|uniref:tetratricopeptide repeat protein n=1 Tax=Nocardia concava TaxID=257281 RepID=UPI0002D7C079|nr:tetratricopeptide repeat protein [Nocardia concava]
MSTASEPPNAAAQTSGSAASLLTHLRELHSAAGSPTAAALLRRIERLGLKVGRSTLYDLYDKLVSPSHSGVAQPAWNTVEAFVHGCLDIVTDSGYPLDPLWTDTDWWEDLHQNRPERRRRAIVQIGRIPPIAEWFQTRSEQAELTPAREGHPPEIRSQVITGMGGVGKTQIAAHAAHRVVRDRQVDLLVWINASTRSSIVDRYVAAASAMDIAVEPATNDQVAEQFLVWLSHTRKRWLIVLDNLVDPNHLRGLWPPTDNGHTLVTTRRSDAVFGEQARVILPIGVFTDEEGLAYLCQSLEVVDAALSDDLAGVAADLGNLPLALSHAAAFIKNKRIPCSRYRQRFAQRRSLTEVLPTAADALPDEYQHTLATTVSMAVDAANSLSPPGIAGPLLEFVSVLHGSAIPPGVFEAEELRDWVETQRTRARRAPADAQWLPAQSAAGQPISHDLEITAESIADGLHCLRLLNLVTISTVVEVHNLVQAVTRERLGALALYEIARRAADVLASTWPDPDLLIGSALRANTATLRSFLPQWMLPHRLLTKAANSRGFAGDPAGAYAEFRELLNDLETKQALLVGGTNSIEVLHARAHAAHWRGLAGDPAGAATELADLEKRLAQIVATNHPLALMVQTSRGSMRARSENVETITDNQRLVTTLLRVAGAEHPLTLTARHNLAWQLIHAGRSTEAVAAYTDLLADRCRILGPDHPDTLMTRENLAIARQAGGDAEHAVTELSDILADRIRVVGPEHPVLLQTRHNLAHALFEMGDLTRALEEYAALRADQETILGPHHPSTLLARINIASIQTDNDAPASTAIAELASVAAECRTHLGLSHPYTLLAQENLLLNERKLERPVASVGALRALLLECERVLGRSSSRVRGLRPLLAQWIVEDADSETAAAMLTQLVDEIRPLDPDHSDDRIILDTLAAACYNAKQFQAAAAAYDELLQAEICAFGPDNRRSLATRNQYAMTRIRMGDTLQGLALLGELLDDTRRVLGPDDPLTLGIHQNVVVNLMTVDHAASIDAHAILRAELTRINGPEDPGLIDIVQSLAVASMEVGDIAGAVTAYRELLDRRLRAVGADDVETLKARKHLTLALLAAADWTGALDAYSQYGVEVYRVHGPASDEATLADSDIAILHAINEMPAQDSEMSWSDQRSLAGLSALVNSAASVQYWSDAAAACLGLLAGTIRVFGADHLEVRTTREALALLHERKGNWRDALRAYHQLLLDQRRLEPTSVPATWVTRSAMARCHENTGNWEGAGRIYAELLAEQTSLLAPGASERILTRSALATSYEQSGNWGAAAIAYRELLGEVELETGTAEELIVGIRFSLARALAAAADWPSAVDAFSGLLENIRSAPDIDHHAVLVVLSSLAHCRTQCNDWAGALPNFEELLALQLDRDDHDDLAVLQTRVSIAQCLWNTDDFARLVSAGHDALGHQLKVLPPDSTEVLTTRDWIAHALLNTGRPAEAVAMLEASLTACEHAAHLGPVALFQLRTNHAIACGKAGDWESAATELTNLVHEMRHHYGDQDPRTVVLRRRLADALQAGQHWSAALNAYTEVLTDQLRDLAPDNPDVLDVRGRIALCHARLGDWPAAAADYQVVAADRLRIFGPNDPETRDIRRALAICHEKLTHWPEAAQIYIDLLADHRAGIEMADAEIVHCKIRLASCLREAQDWDGALAACNDVLTHLAESTDPDPNALFAARGNIAHALAYGGRPAEAIALQQDLLAEQMHLLGPENPDVLASRLQLAIYLTQSADWAAAALAYADLLSAQRRTLEPDHPHIRGSPRALGLCHRNAEDTSAARAILTELLESDTRVFGPDHPASLASRADLASLLVAAGDTVAAVAEIRSVAADFLRVLDLRPTRAITIEWNTATDTRMSNPRRDNVTADPSVSSATQAVAKWRAIADRNPNHLHELALAWSTLGDAHSEEGRHSQAITACVEAIDCFRTLAARNSEHRGQLAGMLAILGLRHAALDQQRDAVSALQEALALYRGLAGDSPEYRFRLASVLFELGKQLAVSDSPHRAIPAYEQAAATFRELVTDNPAYRSNLALVLHNLSIQYGENAEHRSAQKAADEAVKGLRDHPHETLKDLPALASAVTNLGVRNSNLGHHDLAIFNHEEAVGIYRNLPDQQAGLAAALNNLGTVYDNSGRPHAAVSTFDESVALCRTLAAENPTYLPLLTCSLYNLGLTQANLEHHDSALSTFTEVAKICRTIADAR